MLALRHVTVLFAFMILYPMAQDELRGIFVPNVTPFDRQGSIAFDALGDLVDFWVEAGVSGLIVNASTGEAPYLSREERRRLVSFVSEHVDGRVRVIAGTGAPGTRETIELTFEAQDSGAEAALVVTPYFFKPSDEELFQHYATLLATVELPVILYNVPKFTGYSLNPSVLERVALECSNLVGVKDSSSNPGTMGEIIRLVGDRISVLSGAADMILPTLTLGGKGAIVAIANAVPEICVQLYNEFCEGRVDEAGRLQVKASFVNKVLVREHSQIAAIKTALRYMGRFAGVPRRPLRVLSVNEEYEIFEALKTISLV